MSYMNEKIKTDISYKLLLLGDSSVGKTCLLLRYCEEKYADSHLATIGIDYRFKTLDYNGLKVRLQIWDTAGQDKFRAITQSYYKGAHGILLLYDVTNYTSFLNVKLWINQIKENTSKDIVLFIIGNKVDLKDKREVDEKEAKDFASSNNIEYYETSAKSNINVNEVFYNLYEIIYKKKLSNSMSLEKMKLKEKVVKKEKCCKSS